MEFDKLEINETSGVTFLQPCKKVIKENGIGEALTAKPIEAAFIGFTHCPGFEPPSPMYPFRRRSADFHQSIFRRTTQHQSYAGSAGNKTIIT